MKLSELHEGFMNYDYTMKEPLTKPEFKKLCKAFDCDRTSTSSPWTGHKGEDHLFTYVPHSNTLKTDFHWHKIEKHVGEKL